MVSILRHRSLEEFICIGPACDDTCCKGWSMQVDAPTLEKYQAKPDLLSAVEMEPHIASAIMRKDAATSECVKLEGGLCGIQRSYGSDFLSDACYFYPRIARNLGNALVMGAALSCPEIARLALLAGKAGDYTPGDMARLPHGMKNHLLESLNEEQAIALHQSFLNMAMDEALSPEQALLQIANISRSLQRVSAADWPMALPVYKKFALSCLPVAESLPVDPFNLLHAVCGLLVATHTKPSPRLLKTIEEMQQALKVSLDWQHVTIETKAGSAAAYAAIKMRWEKERAARAAPVLRRYLAMQLAQALFPFAGLGAGIIDRITVIGVRFATIKLSLMCTSDYNDTVIIRCVQSLSRLLDHLADPQFSLAIYQETGWTREARLRGLVEA